MAKRRISRASGAVHDLGIIEGLSTEPCNVRLLSDQALYVLYNLANLDIGFLTRYGRNLEGDFYDVALPGTNDESIAIGVNDLISTELGDMTCFDALSDIAIAINNMANRQCCDDSGSGGSGEVEVPPTEQVDDGETSPNPELWPTYQDYLDYKCAAAVAVLAKAAEDLETMTTVNWVAVAALPIGEALLILAATILTPIPGDEIIAFLGLIAGVAGSLVPILQGAQSAFVAVQDQMKCDLFLAGDVQVAHDVALQTWQEQIDATMTGLDAYIARQVAEIFFTFDNFNLLFDGNEFVDYPEADCSECGTAPAGCAFEFQFGSGEFLYNGSEFVISSEFALGFHICNFGLPVAPCCEGNWCVEFVSTTITNPNGTFNRVVYNTLNDSCSLNSADFVGTFPPLATPTLISRCEFTDDASFTVTLKIYPNLRGLIDVAPYEAGSECI